MKTNTNKTGHVRGHIQPSLKAGFTKPSLMAGFTLIELLVVIAIIGILASVVLASLNTARAKGSDAAVKSNLANVRAQAEIMYDTNSCYAAGACTAASPAVIAQGACSVANGIANSIFSDAKFYSSLTAAKTAGGGYDACSAPVGGGAWAVATQLKANNLTAWCVDSSGASKQVVVANTQAGLNAVISAAGACL